MTTSHTASAPLSADPLSFLGTGGEMGRLIRGHDWSSSPLGTLAGWSQALRGALRLLLASPQPMWLGWGRDADSLVFLYNDAYRAVLGRRHPSALGRPIVKVWPEIWDVAHPFVETTLKASQGIHVDTRRFVMDRGDRPEEAFFSFSLTPVADDDGRTGGLLCGNSDDTRRVLSERQLATVAALADSTTGLQAGPSLTEAITAALATNPRDLPFTLVFLQGSDGARVCTACGIDPDHPAAAPGRWPLVEALASPHPVRMDDLAARLGADLPTGAWKVPPHTALLLPLRPPVEGAPPAVLAVALNPYRRLDEGYEQFLRLLARRIESTMGASYALDLARARQEADAALRAAAERAAFLADLGAALRDLGDPQAVMAESVARLGRRLGLARCGYVENDLAAGLGVVTADWTDGRMTSAQGSHDLAGYGASLLERLRQGEPVLLPDMSVDPPPSLQEARDDKAQQDIRAAIGVPLIKDGVWVATLFGLDTQPHDWTPDEVGLAQEAAERTWSALEAVRAARALREGEAFTRDILEASNDCVTVLDLGGRLLFLSGGGQRVLEVEDPSSLQGRFWIDLWPSEAGPLIEAAVGRARHGGVGSFRAEAPTAKGNPRFWDVVVSPIRGKGGQPERLLAILRDITAQRRAEDALRESEARFRTMAESAPVMVWTTDAQGLCTYVNGRWREITGRPTPEALGLGYLSAIHPQDVPDAARAAETAQRPETVEYRLRRADATYAWMLDTAAPRLSPDGTFLGYTGSVVDITDRKRAEERRALLVNELNHRVKNTLATVQSLAAQSFRLGRVDSTVREAFEARLRALSQAHDVLTARDWEGAPLREIVERALAPFGGTDGDHRRIGVEGPPAWLPPPVALAIAMALHELAGNAARHGALSGPQGRVDLSWDLAGEGRGRRLRLSWIESEGPPVTPPSHRGFGMRLIQTGLATELDGEVAVDYRETGVICRLDAPLPAEGTE